MDGCRKLTELNSSTDCGMQNSAYTFSPDAMPFTPRNIIGYATPLHAAVTVLSSTALSVDAPEFYPKNYQAFCKNQPAEYSVVMKVRQAITELTVNPADFDKIVVPLVDLFTVSVREESTLAGVIEEIFVQSMREANFRYTGARMCSYLSEHIQSVSGASFQSYLINRCLAEFDYHYQFSGENLSAIIELTLFLSELMVNMKDIETRQVISHFPQQIAQLLFLLFGKYCQSEIAMHCVVQVLKLTGAVLEENVACLDELFTQIRALILDSNTSQNMRAMLVCLIELRAGNWGRNETDRAVGAGDTVPAAESQNPEQVYLSLLGDETEDSSGLPESCWVPAEDTASRSSVQDAHATSPKAEYWVGDQAMDAETAAAYEEFIADNNSRSDSRSSSEREAPVSYQYKGNWQYQP